MENRIKEILSEKGMTAIEFVSPEEVQPKKDGFSLTCPHCGKSINLKVE